MTDERGTLGAALAKAQGEFGELKRTREVSVSLKSGGRYTFRYAPLDEVISLVRGPLARNGIAVVQQLGSDNGAGYTLTTALLHASGEEIRTTMALPVPATVTPQELGSVITYCRRYQLQAMLGLAAEEDDDANAAEGNAATIRDRGQRVEREPGAPAPPPAPPSSPPVVVSNMTVPFGKQKGLRPDQLTGEQLDWHIKAAGENVNDPDKSKFRAKNEAWQDALLAEFARRQPTPEQLHGPVGDAEKNAKIAGLIALRQELAQLLKAAGHDTEAKRDAWLTNHGWTREQVAADETLLRQAIVALRPPQVDPREPGEDQEEMPF